LFISVPPAALRRQTGTHRFAQLVVLDALAVRAHDLKRTGTTHKRISATPFTQVG
jgi:hypothetical protein